MTGAKTTAITKITATGRAQRDDRERAMITVGSEERVA